MNRIKELYESERLSDEKKEALKLAFRQKFPQYAESSGKTEDNIMQENTIKMSTPKAKVKTRAFAGVAAAAIVLVAGSALAKHIYMVRSFQGPEDSAMNVSENEISQNDTDGGNPMYENEEAHTAAKTFYSAATSAYVDIENKGDIVLTESGIIGTEMILGTRKEQPEHKPGIASELEFAALTDEYAREMGYDAAEWDIEIVLIDQEMPVRNVRVYTDRAQGKFESYPPEDCLTGESDDDTVSLVEYTYTNKDAKMLYDEAEKVFEEFKAEGYDISCNSVSERDYVFNITSPLHNEDLEQKPANTEDNIIDADEFDKALYDLGGMAYTIAWNHPCNFIIEFTSDDGVYATGIASVKVVINDRVSSEKFDTYIWNAGDVLEDETSDETVAVPDIANIKADIAEDMIKSAGYNAELRSRYHENVPEGYVIESEPVAGTTLAAGETVTLFISKGDHGKNAGTEKPTYEDSYTAAFMSKLEERHFSAEYDYYITDDAAPEGRYLGYRGTVEANGDIIHTFNTDFSGSESDTSESYMTDTDLYTSFNGGEWKYGPQTESTELYYILFEMIHDAKDLTFTESADGTDTVTEHFRESLDVDNGEYIFTYDKETGDIISFEHILKSAVNDEPKTTAYEWVFTKFSEDVGELTLPDIG